jgi:hypothetical protein
VDIIRGSILFKLQYLQIAYYVVSLFLCLKESLVKETLAVVQSIRSIILVLLLSLIKRLRQILLISLIR